MTTVRQIERLWNSRSFSKLLREMLANRVEGMFAMEAEMNIAPAAVAAALIRVDELGQAHLPIATTFINFLITVQQADGGWGDVATTALCVKALMTCRGRGLAIDRGLEFLKNLQKSDGLWPRIPIRRTNGDPMATAFVLQQLGHDPRFHATVDIERSLGWYGGNQPTLDSTARRAWERALLRCGHATRTNRPRLQEHAVAWS